MPGLRHGFSGLLPSRPLLAYLTSSLNLTLPLFPPRFPPSLSIVNHILHRHKTLKGCIPFMLHYSSYWLHAHSS